MLAGLTCLKSALLLLKPNSVKKNLLPGHIRPRAPCKKNGTSCLFSFGKPQPQRPWPKAIWKKKSETPKTFVLTVSTFRTRTQTPRKNLIYTANKRLRSLWPAGVKDPSDFLRGFLRFSQRSPRIRQRDRTNATLHESNATESVTGPSNDKPPVLRK